MQKVNLTTVQDLSRIFMHPSTVLYRSIELRQIYFYCKDIKFKSPSLDIGCGDGKLSSILFNNRFTFGLDNGEAHDYQEAIKYKRYEKVLLESAEKMSLYDNSVNFIFSNSVLEHIPNIDSVLKETSRVLNKGGYFVFTTPSKYFKEYITLCDFFNLVGLKMINKMYSKYRNKALNHYHLHDHKYYMVILRSYGLEVVYHSYSVSKEVIKQWDKMALKIKFYKLFGINLEKKVKEQEQGKIIEMYENDKINQNEGANLLIVAKKM